MKDEAFPLANSQFPIPIPSSTPGPIPKIDMTTAYLYQVGGSVPLEAPTYVTRQADADLLEGLRAGEFCYVLNSRQMGKSSLIVRARHNLEAMGIACVALDLSDIGSQEIPLEKWYGGVAFKLARSFRLFGAGEFLGWWQEREFMSPVQRLGELIEEILLELGSQPIVIFIDEIDSILSIKETLDDFFALIRACYNKRAEKPAYNRLTFVLLGVATPSDLISDPNRTPFNIGKAIELNGFTLEEAMPLASGLWERFENPKAVLAEVLAWSGGQPFLTQKICKLLVENSESGHLPQEYVAQLVQKRIIDNWESQDNPEHLRTIRDRILRSEQRAGRLLGLYQKILELGKITADDSLEQAFLRLSGLVVKKDVSLTIYNRIYKAVFDCEWLQEQLDNLRPYSEALNAWLASNRQDESRLLRGQALQEAMAWKTGKHLSLSDDAFLTASHKLALRELETKLDVQQQAYQILVFANQQAEQLLEQARTEAKEGTKLERAGVQALAMFEPGGREIEALLAAMEAGQALQELVRDKRPLKDYPATSPLFALQQILDRIREVTQFPTHQGTVLSISFSPNRKYLATASTDGTAMLWDLSGNLLAHFKGHQGWVNKVSFSPNGQYLATASDDGTAKLWDLSGNLLAQFKGHQGWVNSVSFSPNGKYLATASTDGTAKLWDLSANQIAKFHKYRDWITGVSFSPNGEFLATASTHGMARLWDLSGNLVAEFKGHQGWVNSISFSPNGEFLATASNDCMAKLWDLSGHELAKLRGHNDRVTNISFSPDGEYLATASNDCTARLWDLSGKELAKFRGHQNRVNSVSFSPQGDRLATTSYDGTARLWDLSGNQIAKLSADTDKILSSASITPNWKILATVSTEGTVKLWDLNENPYNQSAELKGHRQTIWSVNFSPNGKYLATASSDGTARLWDLKDFKGKQLLELKGHRGQAYKVHSICFSPQGDRLATASSDRAARVWDLSGNLITELKGHKGTVWSVSFSPNGKYLATASDDGTARLWDLSTQQQMTELKGHKGWLKNLRGFLEHTTEPQGHRCWVTSVCFSPNGKYLATASSDGTARLWDLSGKQLAEFKGHRDWVRCVCFSPDGQYLATASDDWTARVWNLSGNLLAEFKGHQGNVRSVSFSPDGQYLATASDDWTARVWDLSANLLAEFTGHQDWVRSVSFSPDGQYLATASDDCIVRLWPVAGLEKLLQQGCHWLEHYFAAHPAAKARLGICKKKSNSIEAGHNIASKEDIGGDRTKHPHPKPALAGATPASPQFMKTPVSISREELLGEFFIDDKWVIICQGDITTMVADVLVSSDDNYLSMGGGVSARIKKVGGIDIYREARNLCPLPLGEVAVTTAGNLRAKKIFHSVVIDLVLGKLPSEDILHEVVHKCLFKSNEYQFTSIAFPLLGTGAAGMPPEVAFDAILEQVIEDLFAGNTTIRKVSLILYGGMSKRLYNTIATALLKRNSQPITLHFR